MALPLLRWAAFIVLLSSAALASAEYEFEDFRRVVLAEKHGFTRGRSVDISLVEAPGLQKLLVVACRDSTLSVCQGFALDGKTVLPLLREPASYKPDDVFEAFFLNPYLTKLFGTDSSGRVLSPRFTLTHQEDGTISFTYEYQGLGQQRSTIRPRTWHLDFEYLFVGAEVKIGMSDPVGTVSSFN